MIWLFPKIDSWIPLAKMFWSVSSIFDLSCCLLTICMIARYWLKTSFSLSERFERFHFPQIRSCILLRSKGASIFLLRSEARSSSPSGELSVAILFTKMWIICSKSEVSCWVIKNFATASFALMRMRLSSERDQNSDFNSSLVRLNAYLAPILLVKNSLR